MTETTTPTAPILKWCNTFDIPEGYKEIPGYEGLYAISVSGVVRSLDRNVPARNQWGSMIKFYKGKELSLYVDSDGYKYAHLCKDGVAAMRRVSRLVLMTYDRLPNTGEEACHTNHDRANNYIENLHWGTRLENEQEKKVSGRQNPKRWIPKEKIDKAREMRAAGFKLKDIAMYVGCSTAHIGYIVNNQIRVEG